MTRMCGASRSSSRKSGGSSHTSAESARPSRSVRSLVAGSNVTDESAASIIAFRCGCSRARSCCPRLVRARPRPWRTNSAAPTAAVSRRSAALTAGWVR
jgi:hypothetical protein